MLDRHRVRRRHCQLRPHRVQLRRRRRRDPRRDRHHAARFAHLDAHDGGRRGRRRGGAGDHVDRAAATRSGVRHAGVDRRAHQRRADDDVCAGGARVSDVDSSDRRRDGRGASAASAACSARPSARGRSTPAAPRATSRVIAGTMTLVFVALAAVKRHIPRRVAASQCGDLVESANVTRSISAECEIESQRSTRCRDAEWLPAIGFIGFGEAGSTIARGLRIGGHRALSSPTTSRLDTADFGPAIQHGPPKPTALRRVVGGLVRGERHHLFDRDVELGARRGDADRRRSSDPRHLYADLNSVSPAAEAGHRPRHRATGASFVEAAVMAPVLPYGHKVPMLLGGAGATAFAATMTPFGMRLELLEGAKVGSAAAVKMCRSIVVKGLEALLFECVMGASEVRRRRSRVRVARRKRSPASTGRSSPTTRAGASSSTASGGRARWKKSPRRFARSASIRSWRKRRRAGRTGARSSICVHFGPEGPGTYRDVLDAIAAVTSPVSSRT